MYYVYYYYYLCEHVCMCVRVCDLYWRYICSTVGMVVIGQFCGVRFLAHLYAVPRIKLSSSGNCLSWLRPLTASLPSCYLGPNSDSITLLTSGLCQQWVASVQVRETFISGHLKSDLELFTHPAVTSIDVGLSLLVNC